VKNDEILLNLFCTWGSFSTQYTFILDMLNCLSGGNWGGSQMGVHTPYKTNGCWRLAGNELSLLVCWHFGVTYLDKTKLFCNSISAW